MQHRLLNLLLIVFSGLLIPVSFAATPSTFTVVIDPGHGGKDSGTLGTSIKEKDVVLSVGLKLGQLIKKQHPDVKVIYTRSTDVFIPLDQRAMIANKAKANLFISIHADHAETSTVKGVSTFTLGQNRTRENFEIAKRENAVILLEDNYKQRYEGFDPNSAESYIMFEFMQDNYMNQSIQFASILQEKFASSGRKDRGVRQDVFLVLRCTSMPSVLVELGFLSNHEEEQFLKSEEGRDQMALAILRGFSDFKNNYERKSTGNSAIAKKVSSEVFTEVRDSEQSQSQKMDSASKRKNVERRINNQSNKITSDADIIFKVQLIASSFKLKENDKKFRGYELDYFFENKLYKYTYGNFSSFDEANLKRRELRKIFPDAFVIAFKNGQKIAINDAREQTKH